MLNQLDDFCALLVRGGYSSLISSEAKLFSFEVPGWNGAAMSSSKGPIVRNKGRPTAVEITDPFPRIFLRVFSTYDSVLLNCRGEMSEGALHVGGFKLVSKFERVEVEFVLPVDVDSLLIAPVTCFVILLNFI